VNNLLKARVKTLNRRLMLGIRDLGKSYKLSSEKTKVPQVKGPRGDGRLRNLQSSQAARTMGAGMVSNKTQSIER